MLLETLQREYGKDLPGAKYGNSCQQDGIHNASLAIHIGIPAKLLYLVTAAWAQTYITDGENAYSYGLTWRDRYFPEFTIPALFELGAIDYTDRLLRMALHENTFHTRIMKNLENSVPGIRKSVELYLDAL